jgi:prepilin-type N-terminal cleavage/methylation domain-containing protein/prepilin-type processing-associated H-X9-DG protein
MSPSRIRRGFTLIELLVVISIIGVLVGLLLPAIQSARESGRRAKCQSNMRNIVLGVLGYANAYNEFPHSGVFCEDTETFANLSGKIPHGTDPDWSVISRQFLASLPVDTDRKGVAMYSWVVPILPYLESQELYNQWSMYQAGGAVSFFDGLVRGANVVSNAQIASTDLGVLVCPDDNTIVKGQGNLSYVVNGGFTIYHAWGMGWANNSAGVGGVTRLDWSPNNSGQFPLEMSVSRLLGVFFPESVFPQGVQLKIPWNLPSTTVDTLVDGASNTLMISENTMTGVAPTGTLYSNGLPTNWANPMTNFTSFIGSSAVCAGNCSGGGLTPMNGKDGNGWSAANMVGTNGNINGGQVSSAEGSYPFSNSGHPGGCNMGFCDGGVRFIKSTINGIVYSKIITPQGSKLPAYCRQTPVSQDAFAQ